MILPKISGYVKTFKDKGKNKINNIMYFGIDNKKLLEKDKIIWTKIEDLKSIRLGDLPVHDNRYIKNQTRTYEDKVYTNSRGLNVPEGDVDCKSFTIISFYFLLVYENKYYLQVYPLVIEL